MSGIPGQIELKDFKVNTEAYIVRNKPYADTELIPVTVTCVGRKYVKVKLDGNILSFEKANGIKRCLINQTGAEALLFCDKQKAMDITEKRNLRRWLFKKLLHEQAPLSLTQLRAIKGIIENEADNNDTSN